MDRARTLLLTTALLGSITTGCGKRTASDQSLVTDIQSKLYGDAVTKPASVNVTAKDGVVTLSGDVPSSDVELEAMKVANATLGVSSVNDQMKVNPSLAANQMPNGIATGPAAQAAPMASGPAPSGSAPYPPITVAVPPPSAPPPAQEPPRPVSSMPPRSVEPASITVPAGERVSVRMIDSISSAQNTTGQVFRASLYGPLVSRGRVVVQAGAPVSVLLDNAKGAGRIKGNSNLEVRLSQIEYHGRSYEINSSVYDETGKGRGKGTAVRTGIGAGIGALIGGLAGGGRGAAIGAGAGGGAGFGTAIFTHGQQVKIPSETILNFRLESPLTIRQ